MEVSGKKKGTFTYNGYVYDVVVTYKKGKKNITYRFRNNTFQISAPVLTPHFVISNGLKKFAPRLIKFEAKEKPIGKNYVYILGHKVDKTTGIISLGDKKIKFSNDDELKKELKKVLLDIVSDYTKYYEIAMKTFSDVKVSVRDMSTRYGSNSKKTDRISYALTLIHYDIEIIKSIVVHEVAHCIHFNHGKEFHALVRRYCPNYDVLHKKLIKGEYK